MNDDIENRLARVTPQGASPALRHKVLAAVASELNTGTRTRPTLYLCLIASAAAVLAGLALNLWVNAELDRRLVIVLGPLPVPAQVEEIATEIAHITNPAVGQWAYQRLADVPRQGDDAYQYASRLQEMIQQLTFDLGETVDEALKKILAWIVIGTAAAIAVLLLLNAYFVWSTGTRLERRLAELRGAGDPVQLADLARDSIPPEKNADVFLRRATADLDSIQKELLSLYPKIGYPTAEVPPADQKKLESIFVSYPRVMPLLEQTAACPGNDPQLDRSMLPSRFLQPYMDRASKHRLLARVLRARCALLLSQGRPDEAIANQVLLLRITRHWRREPLLFAYLITAVCEQTALEGANQVLQKSPLSPASRQALDAELALHDSLEGCEWALRSERAFSLSATREMPGTSFWLTRGFANDLMLRLIEVYDRFLEEASLPYAVVVSEKNAKARPGGGPNPYGALVTLLKPGLAAVREPAERTRAMSRCLRVLNTLQARPLGKGDTAPKLVDLGLPSAVTTDPFDGQPLRVKQLPEGWIVYSVGGNLIDDGGKLDGKTDIGAGPARLEPGHIH